MNTKAIRAAWAEWDAASAATDEAYVIVKAARNGQLVGKKRNAIEKAHAAWVATLTRTEAARLAVAGLPDLEEVEAFEAAQASEAAQDAAQLQLI